MNLKTDKISENQINALLSGSVFNVRIVEEAVSTNTLVKEEAENGAKEGLVIIAKKQTGGRGRMGRSFHSPENSGLYMSLLLRPDFCPDETLFITCAAAVAVCRALEKFTDKKMGIKWVNDIYSGGKKICGILTEAAFTPDGKKLSYAVLGIGINLYPPKGGFSPEIKDIAGAVFEKEIDESIKNEIASAVLCEFLRIYEENDRSAFISEYKSRSVLYGAKVDVLRPNSKKSATVLYIDDDLKLHVAYEDGTRDALFSGEVSIKKLSR